MTLELISGEHYPTLGYCMLNTGRFLTLVSENPPAGQSAQVLESNNWEVYYQPVAYNWKGNPSWVTTYRSKV